MMDKKRTHWLRGILDLCVLAALSNEERYGYELAQYLEESGLGKIKGGTLYPLLARLEKAGQVTTHWREGSQGPSRKYYALTPSGIDSLNTHSKQWSSFTDSVHNILLKQRNK